MRNRTFNSYIKKFFNSTSSDSQLQDLAYSFWMNHNTTDDQNDMLTLLVDDAEKGLASSPTKYFLME
jgi:hypothetical protein